MSTLATLVVKLLADISDFQKNIEGAQDTFDRVGQNMQTVGKGLTLGVSAPIMGIGTAATLAAREFNSGMANIASLGDEAAGKIKAWKPAIQDVAVAAGKSTRDMTDGMYMIVSAYGAGSEAVAQLGLNAKLAAAGLSTTTEAIKLTSAVTKGYGDTTLAAQKHVADLAMLTVSLGQTTFPELAASMGRVVPIAASLGVQQKELFAVMATATGVTGQAAEVSTQLRGVLQSLMAPTGDMSKLMVTLGYETGAAALKGMGLQGTLDAIVKAANDSGTPLQKYIGSIEGQTLALALAGPQAETFRQKLDAMGTASGTLEKAFAAQTQGVNASGFAMEQAKIKVEVLLQRLGDGLAPAILDVIDAATPFIAKLTDMATRFAELDPQTQTIIVAIAGMAAAIGPLLVIVGTLLPALTALGTVVGVVGTVLGVVLSPIGLVVIAIAALVAGVILLVTHWEEVKATAERVWEAVRAAVVSKVEEARQKVEDFVQGVKEFFENFDLGEAARTLFGNLVSAVTEMAGEALKAAVGWLDDTFAAIESFDLKAAAQAAFETVVVGTGEKVEEALGKVGDWLDDSYDTIKTFDLKAAAQTAFETVVVGTGEKVAEALGKVGDWLNDSYDTIRNFDLKGAATTAFNTVVLGQAERTAEALTKTGGWLSDTAAKIRGHSFKSETMTAFATAVAGLMDKVGEALTKTGEWLKDTSSKIQGTSFKAAALTAFQTVVAAIADKAKDILARVQQFLNDSRDRIANFSLRDVGVGLIQGLIDGIGSMGSALAGAMRSLIQSAIDHIKSIFGIKSPSIVMANEVGKPLALGIAQGIIDNAPATGTALDTSISVLLANLTAAIKVIVEEFKKLAELYASDSSLMSAKAVADPLGDLFEKLSDVAAGVAAVSGLALTDIRKAEANAQPFAEALKAIVGYMKTVAEQFTTQGWVENITAFAEGAEAAIEPVKDGVEALVTLSQDMGKVDGKTIGANMEAFSGIIGGLVRRMSWIAEQFTTEGWGESVKAFSEGALAAIAPVKDGVEALVAISEGVGKLDGKTIGDNMEAFTGILGGLVMRMKAVAIQFKMEGWVESVKAFSEGALAATAPVKGGVEALIFISEGVGKLDGKTIGDKMEAFVGILGGLVERIRLAANYFNKEGWVDKVKDFSAGAVAATAPVENGLKALLSIQDNIGKINGSTIGEDMRIFAEILGGFVAHMRDVAVQFGGPGLESVKTFSAAAVAAAAAILAASDAIVTKGLPKAVAFADASATIGQKIIDGMQSLTRPAGYGPGVTGVMTMIQDAVVGSLYNMQAAWQSLSYAAYLFGQNWVGQIINGIRSRQGDLVALLAYIRGLFPSSPAKYGPWKDLPDGQKVGQMFADGLTSGLKMDPITTALGALRATADGRQQTGGKTNNVTVNIYNPIGQTAETSVLRQMRNLATVGAI